MKPLNLRLSAVPIAAALAICLCGSPTWAQSKSAADTLPAAAPAPPAAPAADSTAPARIILPERTEIHVRIDKDIKSGADKVGDEVPFEVEDDVYSPSHILLITAGTHAFGKIVQSSRRGMFGKAGKLRFTCDYILAPDGTHIPLRSDPIIERGKDNRGATAAVTILLSPLGLFVNGKDITVKKDTQFTMYVDKNTPVVPFAAPPTPQTSAATTSASPHDK